jgi:membrane protease YdiL (CAAX protease family)
MNEMQHTEHRQRDAAAVVFALAFPTLVTWVYFVWLAGEAPVVQQTSYTIGKLIQFAFPLVWFVAIQRNRLRWETPKTAGLAGAAGFGALVVTLMFLLYHAYLKPAGYCIGPAEVVQQKVAGFGAGTPARYAALGIFYSACHSFLEEYYWRWFVFAQLRRLGTLRTAIIVSSVGFMAHHVLVLATFFGWASPATWIFSASIAVGGAIWAWLYERTRSLYGPWLSHLIVDAGIFAIGYDLLAFPAK